MGPQRRWQRPGRRHAQDPTQVAVGIETDQGLLVGALLAAGFEPNFPLVVS
jgi:hypothetical protein